MSTHHNTEENETRADDNCLEPVIGGAITVSASMAGFMLLFVGLVLGALERPGWLDFATLFVANAFLSFFYRAMVRGWNILAVRAVADAGDEIIQGRLTKGRTYAAFRTLWGFQPILFQGSWVLLLLACLYGASKAWQTVPWIAAGFLFGILAYAILGDWRWKTTWRRCSKWDRTVYLGEPTPPMSLPFHQRIFAKFMLRDSISRSPDGEAQEKDA